MIPLPCLRQLILSTERTTNIPGIEEEQKGPKHLEPCLETAIRNGVCWRWLLLLFIVLDSEVVRLNGYRGG